MALASPSYLAMTYDLVGREDLANANRVELNTVSAFASHWSGAVWLRVQMVWAGGLFLYQWSFFYSRRSVVANGTT